jgi:peptidoglycan/LPS O-acetylase OafA/YrhL/lysophospholipase L1-like esterase
MITSPPDSAAPAPARFPHLPALDGLRGVAVALVVAYHLLPSTVPGGFLGVDVFFVLSGFLITSLLLDEVAATSWIDLRGFYVRRVRRLAPALLLLLAAIAAYAAVWATVGELTRLRQHSLWALGYLANWKLIADGTTYTDVVAGQSPLRHTWSLAIEEQFYVLFPLLVLVVGRSVRWRHDQLRRALLGLSIGGALASAAWMAVLWGDGSDPSRGYFGTDTRAQSLLVGVGLGAVLVGRPPTQGRPARCAAAVGAVGAGVLIAAVATTQESSAWLQHGGFLVVALAVAGVISALGGTRSLGRSLSVRPLVALGGISYGVYLWHWPIIVLVDASRSGVDGPLLAALRLTLTLAAASASAIVLERPIRRGAVARRLGAVAPLLAPASAAAVVLLLLASTTPPPEPTMPAPVLVARTVQSRPDGPRDVILFGDSVAHTLAGGVVGAFPDFRPWSPDQSSFDPTRVRLWSVARPACSFLPGLMEVDGAQPADLSSFCDGWQDQLRSALTALPGATVVVALANDASDRRLDGGTVRLGSAAHRALLGALLDEVRTRALADGGALALLALPPRTGSFATALDADGHRERLMREELRAYADRHPGTALLDLSEQICPDGDCDRPARGFDPAWRYDGMHFTREGAGWAADWITAQLLDRPS